MCDVFYPGDTLFLIVEEDWRCYRSGTCLPSESQSPTQESGAGASGEGQGGLSEHEWEKMYQATLARCHGGMRRVIPCAMVSLSPQCQGRPFWAMDGTGAARSLSVERSRARRPNSSTSSRYARIPVRHIDCQLLKALKITIRTPRTYQLHTCSCVEDA